jgi:AcrR family transcriptional regulator
MLVTEGFDGFSMQKLAKAAGVSPATLYIHFEDKDDLLFQLYREQYELFTDAVLLGFDPDTSFVEGLRTLWKNRLHFARENPTSQRFLDQILYSPYHRGFEARLGQKLSQAMEAFVRGAFARKEIIDFREIDPTVDFPVEVFWALAYAPLYQLIEHEMRCSGPGDHHRGAPFRLDDKLFEKVFQRVLRGLSP